MVTGTKEVEWKRLGQQASGEEMVTWAWLSWHAAAKAFGKAAVTGGAQTLPRSSRGERAQNQNLTRALLRIPGPQGLPVNVHEGSKWFSVKWKCQGGARGQRLRCLPHMRSSQFYAWNHIWCPQEWPRVGSSPLPATFCTTRCDPQLLPSTAHTLEKRPRASIIK